SKAQNSGWIVITWGWGLGVAMAVFAVGQFSGAHLNPAVTLGFAAMGNTDWSDVPKYLAGEFVGAFIGATLVWAAYSNHWKETEDPGLKLAVFSTGPAIRNTVANLITEIIGTFLLVFGVLAIFANKAIAAPEFGLGGLLVGLLVLAIGLSLGGPTGYAINPARDLGPRIMLLLVGFGSVAFPGPNHGLSLIATTIGPIIGGIIGALFFDKVMRPNIPGHEVEGSHVTTLSQLAYDPTMEVRSETLHGHAARLPLELVGADHIDLVMVDAGGCIYDDDSWALAVLNAARQLAPGDGIDETEFWSVYDAQRQAQGGSLSRTVATRFLPSGDPEELNQLARSQFQVPAASMYPDARPTLAALATRYKLGVVANPSEQHIAALERDGLMQYFDVVVHPEQVDLAKTPSPRMWKRALEETGVQANRAVHVGNRIDNDIRPAKQAGLHTIWLLRGEAPPSPTVEQLAEADAIVTTFSGVPNALVAISPSRTPATTA
ncbi:MAG: aquaporin, partial [Actinomycetes bacterium]